MRVRQHSRRGGADPPAAQRPGADPEREPRGEAGAGRGPRGVVGQAGGGGGRGEEKGGGGGDGADHAGECGVAAVVGRVEVLQREAGAGEDAVGVEADPAGVGVGGGYGGVGQGGAEGVCEWVAGHRGEHVCDDGPGDHGGKGVRGEEDWGHVAVSGKSCLVVRKGTKGQEMQLGSFSSWCCLVRIGLCPGCIRNGICSMLRVIR